MKTKKDQINFTITPAVRKMLNALVDYYGVDQANLLREAIIERHRRMEMESIRSGQAPMEADLTVEERRGMEEMEKSRGELHERERKARLANKKSA